MNPIDYEQIYQSSSSGLTHVIQSPHQIHTLDRISERIKQLGSLDRLDLQLRETIQESPRSQLLTLRELREILRARESLRKACQASQAQDQLFRDTGRPHFLS